MSLDKLWTLVSKKLAGEASEEELREMEDMVQRHPDWQNAIEQMEQLWKQKPQVNQQAVEDAYAAHLYKLAEKKIFFAEAEIQQIPVERKSGKLWWWAAAASVIIVLSFFMVRYTTGDKEILKPVTDVVSEISTKPQSKSRLQLPDGSIVWLNAGSKLVYSPEFGQKNREVELVGEAFFDVVKNPDKPFIINTTNVQIRVLGTAFNVKAYKGDKVTETSLVRGRIEVTIRNRPEKTIVLRPFEKLVVENEPLATKMAVVQKPRKISIIELEPRPIDSSIVETSWMQDELKFREEKFEDLARMMEIRFRVHIDIRDPKLRERRFTGSWTDETIKEALEALKFSVPFEYKMTPEEIIIDKH